MDKENVSVVATNEPTKELTMSRDILEYEMNSGKIYESEEKVTRTDGQYAQIWQPRPHAGILEKAIKNQKYH